LQHISWSFVSRQRGVVGEFNPEAAIVVLAAASVVGHIVALSGRGVAVSLWLVRQVIVGACCFGGRRK
jgi:hypothetical protein